MKKEERGVTIIALIIIVVLLLILSAITLEGVKDKRGLINQSKETTQKAQKESIIQKIEADLYQEKVKIGRKLTKEELKLLIEEKEYASSISDNEFVTKEGNYTIEYNEIMGWK